MSTVGSRPARSRTLAIIDVVVVFPWVPTIAILRIPSMRLPSISARCSTCTPLRRAICTSTFASGTARLMTTT